MTISPQNLTAEERAIVDAVVLKSFPTFAPDWSYPLAIVTCEPIILARRALFTPESEKPEWAKEFIATLREDSDAITALRAAVNGTPESEKPAQAHHGIPCIGCGEYPMCRCQREALADFIEKRPEPAQKEPVTFAYTATPGGSVRVVSGDGSKWFCSQTEPVAAGEEPKAPWPCTASDVRKCIQAGGYLTTEQHNDFGRRLPTGNMGACMASLADALEEIEALRAKVRELEERVPRWCGDEEHSRLLALAWTCAPDAIWHRPPGAIEAEWHFLMVPPIPLLGEER